MPKRRRLRNQSSLHKHSIIVGRIYIIQIYTLENMNIFFCWICSANNSGKNICICQSEDVCGAQCEKLKLQFYFYSQIWHFVYVCPICWGPICRGPFCRGPICPSAIWWGPICRANIFQGPYLQGPDLPGSNLPQNQCGAQFAAKSARGLIYQEPHNVWWDDSPNQLFL